MTGPVEIIFIELQIAGLIHPKRKLKKTKNTSTFKADTIFKKKIFYNTKHENISADSIRFALLHEEGHIINKQSTKLLLSIIFLMIFSSMGLVYYFTGFNVGKAYPIIYGLLPIYLILGLFSIRIFTQPIQLDESNADKFAAMKLQEYYAYRNNGMILARLLEEINSGEKKETLVTRIKELFFYGMHPSDEDRVNMIIKEVDEKA